MNDGLKLGDRVFSSRLLLGTGKFSDTDTMIRAVRASQTELVTVALRRFHPGRPEDDVFGPLAALKGITLMPNTSGAMDAKEAVRAALLGRELSGNPFVKLEIHPNPHHLLPDPIETYEAAKILVKEGFFVLPYMPADPVLAKRLEEIGCAAVMPLGAAIGSGQGLTTIAMLRQIIRDASIPVIVDAGLRSPSEAAQTMELGGDAVLVNSAIAAAENPELMASAFAAAVRAGRDAWKAGLMPRSETRVRNQSPDRVSGGRNRVTTVLPDWLSPIPWMEPARRAHPGASRTGATGGSAGYPGICRSPFPRRRRPPGDPGATRPGADPTALRTSHLALRAPVSLQLLPGRLHVLRIRLRPQDRPSQAVGEGTGGRVGAP